MEEAPVNNKPETTVKMVTNATAQIKDFTRLRQGIQ